MSCLEQWSKNTARPADTGTDTSVPSQNIVDVMTTGVADMLNPVFGFQIRGQNNQEVTTTSLPKSTVATQGLYNHTHKKKTAFNCDVPTIILLL